MKKITKKFGIVLFLRDWKEGFDEVQKGVNKILKLHPSFKIHDDEFNPGDDNIYTVMTNFPGIKKIESFIEEEFFNCMEIESDKNAIAWFDDVKELKALVKKAVEEQAATEKAEEAEYQAYLQLGIKGQRYCTKLEKEMLAFDKFNQVKKKFKLSNDRSWSVNTAAMFVTVRELSK